jgi:thiol-disulfide isomerase/thioredoxin
MIKKWSLIGLIVLMITPCVFAAEKDAKIEAVKSKLLKTENKGTYKTVNGVKLRDIRGGLIDLSHYKGKVLVINFFATWCPPCVREMPHIVELQKELGPNGLQIFGVSADDNKSVLPPFIKKFKVNYPIAMDNPDLVSTFGDIEGIPTTFIVDRQLRIVDKFTGYTSKEEFVQKVRKWL